MRMLHIYTDKNICVTTSIRKCEHLLARVGPYISRVLWCLPKSSNILGF